SAWDKAKRKVRKTLHRQEDCGTLDVGPGKGLTLVRCKRLPLWVRNDDLGKASWGQLTLEVGMWNKV
ncbi:hypothetical protein LEMLEM_LOCUS7563, partial [Lemmus lemmus]